MGGPALLSRIDRDVLDQPGLTTVLVNEGLEDVLNGHTANDLTTDGYTQLLTYLEAYNINVVVVGLTPCDGYTGDNAATNDACTSTVDANRVATNGWLAGQPNNLNPWTSPSLYYLDSDATIGTPDTSNGEIKLDGPADVGDHVNLSYPGYGALAAAFLGPQDTWQLNDGGTNTTAADSASNTNSPYLVTNPLIGQSPATLAGGATWTSDATRGEVLQFDGSSRYAATGGPVLTTNHSFSVSAWVKIDSSNPALILSQEGTNAGAFFLAHDGDNNAWTFATTGSDTTNPPLDSVGSNIHATIGAWTHLVGVYNADAETISIYVNGTLAGWTTAANTWNATGSFIIGRGPYNGTNYYFPGAISDVQTWNYALTDTEATELADQVS